MYKILIADDEVTVRERLKEIVSRNFKETVSVLEAGSGKEAVEKVLLNDADLAVLDIEMPLMNGLEAAGKILQAREDCKVIFLTAYALFEYAKQAVSLGASEFLLKPVSEEEVIKTIKRFLDEKEEKKQTKLPEIDEKAEASLPQMKRVLPMVTEAHDYIRDYYMKDISVESLADRFHLSQGYFSRLFKAVYGCSCADYIISVRIEQSKRYLEDPIWKVKDVGGLVGYGDPNYFAKIFRKKCGMSPTEYRNQHLFPEI